MHVHIQPPAEEDQPAMATIGAESFPVAGYAIEPGDGGEVMVSLVFAPTSVAVGNPPVAPPVKTAAPVQVWGSPGPDPRIGLAGFGPGGASEALAAQIASNARRAAQ